MNYFENTIWEKKPKLMAALLILPWLFLHFYNHQNWDDLCYINFAINKSFAGLWEWMDSMNSRFIGNSLIAYQPATYLGNIGYIFSSLIVSVFFMHALYRFLAEFIPAGTRIAFFVFFFAVLIRNLAEPSETFYWYPAVVTYLIPLTLLLYVFSPVKKILSLKSADKAWYQKSISLLALGIIISLIGEQLFVMFLGCLCVILLYQFLDHKKVDFQIVGILLLLIPILLWIASQKGNMSRMGVEVSTMPMAVRILSAVVKVFKIGAKLFLEPGSLIIIFSGIPLFKPLARIFNYSKQNILLIVLLAFGLMLTGPLLNFIAFGSGEPSRSTNISYISGWLVLSVLLGHSVAQNAHSRLMSQIIKIPRASIVVIFAYALTSNNIFRSYQDLFWNGPLYIKERIYRAEMIENGKGQDIVFRSPKAVPYTVIYSDLSSDKNHPGNECEAELNGVKSIIVEKDKN